MKAGRGPTYPPLGAFATQNGTWGAFGGDASRWFEGRLRTLVGAGAGQFNLDFYGLGSGSSFAQSGRALFAAIRCGSRAGELATRTQVPVGRRRPLRLRRRRPQATYPALSGLADRVRVTISAPTAIVEFDTRDNLFTPTRGVYAESSWLASRETLGATDDFERFQQVLIGWYPLAQT